MGMTSLNWQTTYTLIIVLCGMSIIGLAMWSWSRRQSRGVTEFVFMLLAIAVWTLCYAYQLTSTDPGRIFLWSRLKYIGIVSTPVFWLLFTRQFTGSGEPLLKRDVGLLFIIPVITLLFVFTNNAHHLFWASTSITSADNMVFFNAAPGPWLVVHSLYNYGLLIAGVVVLVGAYGKGIYRAQTAAIVLAVIIPVIFVLINETTGENVTRIDPTPLGLTISSMLMGLSLINYGMMDILPLAQDKISENLPDGILVLDKAGHVWSVNRSFRRQFAITQEQIIGQPLADVVPQIAALLENPAHANNGSSLLRERDLHLVMRVSELKDQQDRFIGRVITTQDVTEQQNAEAERLENERRFRALFEHTYDAIFIFSMDLKLITVNARAADMLGTTTEAMVGMSVERYVFPDEIPDMHRRIQQLQAGETIPLYERTFVRQDGTTLTGEVNIALVQDINGEPLHIQSVVRDITERKQAERAIQQREASLSAIISSVPIVLFTTDNEGIFTLVHGTDLERYGMNQESLVGQSAFSFYESAPVINQHLQAALAGETTKFIIETGTFTYESRFSPLYDEAGNQRGVIGVSSDISDRHEMQAELDQNRAQFEMIFKVMPGAAVFTNPDSTVQMVNQTFSNLFGYAVDELTGQSAEILYNDPEDYIEQGQLRFNSDVEPSTDTYEVTYKRKDGTSFVGESLGIAVREANGDLLGYLTILQDITARKVAEAERQERMTQLAILRQVDEEVSSGLQINHVLMIALDATFRLSQANAGFIALAEDGKIRVAKTIGHYTPKVMNAELHAEIGITGRVIQTHKPELISDVSKDPDYYPDLADTKAEMVLPLISQDRFIGMINLETYDPEHFTHDKFEFLQLLVSRIAVAIDNANLYQQAREQLEETQRLYEQVKVLETLKTDMIRIASHDLRNPLGVITGYLSMLMMDTEKFDETYLGFFEAMSRAARRMSKILEDILSLERIQQMASTDTDQLFQLRDQVEMAVAEYSDQATGKAQEFKVELDFEEALNVFGDPVQMYEAIANLISNAIKYTPEAGTVRVILRRDNRKAVLQVIDTGYGIPEDQQAQLFQPFFRADVPETTKISGTGLGLHLVKNIIDRHRGTMIFESEYGKGSTFGFEIPLADPVAEP